MPKQPKREDDERTLAVLAARSRGETLTGIAARTGLSAAAASRVIARTRLADVNECKFWGDNPKSVLRWWRETVARA